MKFNLPTVAAVLFCLFTANQATAITFKFAYDPNYANYWSAEVKAQIEEAGGFLASYISDNHTVDITISVDPNISAYAIGAPNEWLTNTNTKSISKKGSIAYSVNSLQGISQASIVALTIHELMHCLGVTSSGSLAFASKIKNGYYFDGAKTKQMNGGSMAPLAADQSHFQGGHQDPKGVSPRISDGGGNLISALDLALLADLGYNVPEVANASSPKYIPVTINDKYGFSMGPFTVVIAQGNNDILYGGSGQCILAGLGGADVLVSGSGSTEMWGDNHQMSGNVMGSDGGDIFYIKTNQEHSIKDLDPSDQVYISPSLGITKAEIDAAGIKDGYYVGEYELEVGSFKLKLGSKDGSKPGTGNILVKNWTK